MTDRVQKQRRITSERVDPAAPASVVINKFGGLTRFCEITNWPTSTVHGWTVKGLIPSDRFERILELAAEHRVPVAREDFVPELAVANG